MEFLGKWVKLGVGAGLILALAGCTESSGKSQGAQPYAKSQRQAMQTGLSSDLPQQVAPAFTRLPFLGSKSQKIVHRSDCAVTDAIPAPDREHFRNFKQAADAGYQPCGACRPDRP